jgi:hypothetical protein
MNILQIILWSTVGGTMMGLGIGSFIFGASRRRVAQRCPTSAPGSADALASDEAGADSWAVRQPATVQELAKELDSGQMPQASRRELFICMIAARDLVDYLRDNSGDNADWPIDIRADNPDSADGLVAKLNSLEKLLPPNAAHKPSGDNPR